VQVTSDLTTPAHGHARRQRPVREPNGEQTGETDQPWAPFTLQGVLGWLEPVYRRWLAQRPALLEDRRYVGPALNRVAVEHRGWERLTEEQVAQDCALPDGYRAAPTAKAGRSSSAATGAPPVPP